jgi:hypothetical protein
MAFRRPAGPGEGPPSILGVPTVDASVRLSIIFDARFVAIVINGRDLAWVDDDEGPLPHPARDQA